MNYTLKLTPEAESDIEKCRKTGDKKLLLKINRLFDELRIHPTYGTGKPERLKHYVKSTWSRRVTAKHRLIYRIDEKEVIIIVLSLWGHYSDK